MPGYCCVPLCKKSRYKDNDVKKISYHRVPEDPEMHNLWIAAIRRKPPFRVSSAAVCSRHFKEGDFLRNIKSGRRMLCAHAVPSLHLPDTSWPPSNVPQEVATAPSQTVQMSPAPNTCSQPVKDQFQGQTALNQVQGAHNARNQPWNALIEVPRGTLPLRNALVQSKSVPMKVLNIPLKVKNVPIQVRNASDQDPTTTNQAPIPWNLVLTPLSQAPTPPDQYAFPLVQTSGDSDWAPISPSEPLGGSCQAPDVPCNAQRVLLPALNSSNPSTSLTGPEHFSTTSGKVKVVVREEHSPGRTINASTTSLCEKSPKARADKDKRIKNLEGKLKWARDRIACLEREVFFLRAKVRKLESET